MKLKDLHKDIERFLQEDCYCPNEFYSFDGFFYKIFDKDTEIEYLGETDLFIVCIEKESKPGSNQVLLLWKSKDGEKITDNLRFDATDNNLIITKEHLLKDHKEGTTYKFDEFKLGENAKMINKILNVSDAVIYD